MSLSLESALQQINYQFDALRTDIHTIKTEMNGMKADMNGMKVEMKAMNSNIAENTTMLDHLLESSLRVCVEKQFGSSFAKAMTCVSLANIVDFCLTCLHGSNLNQVDYNDLNAMTQKVPQWFNDNQVAVAYCRALLLGWCELSEDNCDFVKSVFGQEQIWISTIPKNWIKFIAYLGCNYGPKEPPSTSNLPSQSEDSNTFKNSLLTYGEGEKILARCRQLGALMTGTDPGGDLSSYKTCGISLAVFVSAIQSDSSKSDNLMTPSYGEICMRLKDYGVKDGKPWNIPNEIEMDCRGNIAVVQRHCTINAGEVKSSSALVSSARKQLRLRLSVLRDIIGIMNSQINSWTLIGYIFLPKSGKKSEEIDDQITDGISYRVVYL